MKQTIAWNPLALLQSPLFTPLHPALERFAGAEFPSLSDWNRLLAGLRPAIRVHGGQALRFVPQEHGRLAFEAQYEPRCYLKGEVQTRENNWHDFFNGLVWLAFPKAKAAINARHYLALTAPDRQAASPARESGRGGARDMATLFDESGVIIACADPELADLLRSFEWKALFWQRRARTRSAMDFYLFGHGLHEKAMQPYAGMTGQGLLLMVEQEFFDWSLADRLSWLDQHVAGYLNSPEHCRTTRELHPVPLLGLPGWTPDNEREDYYDNTAYFRSGRTRAAGA